MLTYSDAQPSFTVFSHKVIQKIQWDKLLKITCHVIDAQWSQWTNIHGVNKMLSIFVLGSGSITEKKYINFISVLMKFTLLQFEWAQTEH